MAARVNGLHHVTSGVWGAQEDIDFFTQVVGQRMIKQTILFDGTVSFYHLYYANADAEIGSVSTTFPFSKMGIAGRRGSGQVNATGYSVPLGSIPFWKEHFKRHGTEIVGEGERFGQKTLHFRHPAGLDFEMIEDKDDKTKGWTTKEIKADTAVRGFHSVAMSVRDTEEQERFLTDGLGLTKVGVDGNYHRFRINEGGAQKTVDLVHVPDQKQGSWQFAPGIVHHVAFAVPTEKEQTGGQGASRRHGLHRRLGDQGPQLFPLDLLPLAGRHPVRGGDLRHRLCDRRAEGASRREAAAAAMVREPPRRDRGAARGDQGAAGRDGALSVFRGAMASFRATRRGTPSLPR